MLKTKGKDNLKAFGSNEKGRLFSKEEQLRIVDVSTELIEARRRQ